jgi:hypothetical protein
MTVFTGISTDKRAEDMESHNGQRTLDYSCDADS